MTASVVEELGGTIRERRKHLGLSQHDLAAFSLRVLSSLERGKPTARLDITADVYKGGQLAASLQRTPAGVVFEYCSDYAGPALASDLPSTLFTDDTTMALTKGGRDTLGAKRLRKFSASLGLPVVVSYKVVADLLARTASLGDQLFDHRAGNTAAGISDRRFSGFFHAAVAGWP